MQTAALPFFVEMWGTGQMLRTQFCNQPGCHEGCILVSPGATMDITEAAALAS